MIVYVESNFVLELAFLQEELESAEAIVALAGAGRIRLVLPAYSVGEPYERVVRRARDRRALHEKLAGEIRELARSKPYSDVIEASRELSRILTESAEAEKLRLDAALLRLLEVAEVIRLNGLVLQAAIELQPRFDLSPQDAIVFASVQRSIDSEPDAEPKLFLTKNRQDFLTPDIEQWLEQRSCKLLTRFADGIGYLTSVLDRTG